MRNDMIWGNDEKYTKEYQIKCREDQIKKNNELKEKLEQYETNKSTEEQVIGSTLRKYREETRVRGEIFNPLIKQHLDFKLLTAKWALFLAMAMTCLFNGQLVLWIVFYLIYRTYVKTAKAEALENDLKGDKKK